MAGSIRIRVVGGYTPQIQEATQFKQQDREDWIEALDTKVAGYESVISYAEATISLGQIGMVEACSDNRVTQVLMALTVAPLMGAIGGAVKTLGGVAQTIASLAVGIFAGLASPFSYKAREVAKHAFRHLVHGVANIVAGVIDATPLLSLAVGKLRMVWAARSGEDNPRKQLHIGKLFAYCRVLEQEWIGHRAGYLMRI